MSARSRQFWHVRGVSGQGQTRHSDGASSISGLPCFLRQLDDRFHETCVMELMVWLRIPRLRLAKRGARSWQDGGG
jgi:hypothetical protein